MKVLLVGPYDPFKGNFSFVSPPLGIWRICGFLRHHGIECEVYDPNLSPDPYEDMSFILSYVRPAIVGFSITGLTLPYDLSLIHWAKEKWPEAVYIGGGIEAAFNYKSILSLAPLDYCILGEGEVPLLEICDSVLKRGYIDKGIPGLAYADAGNFVVNSNSPLNYKQFRFATFNTPYHDMPIRAYWDKIMQSYDTKDHSEDEKKTCIQEVKSVRLMTSNYCPMKCTFCSYTNFLNFSCNCNVKVVRLTSGDILHMIVNIVRHYPEVKTIIFQDDIFVLKADNRILSLCNGLKKLKKEGVIPDDITFMATTRVDTMQLAFLESMHDAGFRLIGYGIESFSRNVLREYGKEGIYNKIDDVLNDTLRAGIKPFLDIILASPGSTLDDVVYTLNKCVEYILKGCEVSIYPTVIPFSGAEIVNNPYIQDLIFYEYAKIPRTEKNLWRRTGIQPRQEDLQKFILNVHQAFEKHLEHFKLIYGIRRFPSRLRSMIYILSVIGSYPGLINYSEDHIINQIAPGAARQV